MVSFTESLYMTRFTAVSCLNQWHLICWDSLIVLYAQNYSDFSSIITTSVYDICKCESNNALIFKNRTLTLWVEEARHPKRFGSPFKHPAVELLVSLQKLCEPEAQRGGLPGDFPPQVWHAGIKNIVQGIAEILRVK